MVFIITNTKHAPVLRQTVFVDIFRHTIMTKTNHTEKLVEILRFVFFYELNY